MSFRVWRSGEPRESAFESDWNATLAEAPYGHFAMRLDWMEWGHTRGIPALAVLVEERGFRGVIAARKERGEWISGLPWRWQAAIAAPGRGPEAMLAGEEAGALFSALSRAAGGARVRAYLPAAPSSATTGFLAGKTLLHRVDVDDDALLRAMDKTKRAMIRRARREGYEAVETLDPAMLRAFAAVQRETDLRHGKLSVEEPDSEPGPGEQWREWELAWMWLLLAVRAQEVRSGFGFALGSGTLLESRAAGSTREALRDGAFVLLAFESARRARERGYRYLNWGGDTFFKRDVSGDLGVAVPLYAWLGGGATWAVLNRGEAVLRGARSLAGRLSRASATTADREEDEPPAPRARAAPAPAPRPLVSVWRTHAPIEDAFREEWNRRVSGAPHSNFTLDLRYLAHEAAGGKHSWAVLAEEGERSAAFVLRESNGELVSGWPWRWQAVLAGRPAHLPSPFEPGDSAWLHGIARAVGHGKRLRMFLPAAAESSISCYPAGATVLQPLERADDEILASMNSSKRRMVRKARDLSYAISEAGDDDSFRAFAELQRLTAERRGYRVIDAAPDAWREWSLPWMWLLVARRDGRIVSGAGDGIFQGGTVEGRAGASTAQARRDGAFALVCFEEVRRARDRGHRWLNHCGDTAFKREIAGRLGVRVPIWCWMVGGALAGAQDHVEAAWKTLRPRAAALFRSRGPMQTGLPLALGFALESALREGPSWLS